jgi:hypothetical protein
VDVGFAKLTSDSFLGNTVFKLELLKRRSATCLNRKHTKQWETIIGLKQANELITGPSAKRTRDLLKLNRDQLRWIVGLYTVHCHLKGHLFKMGLMNDPTCERCLEAD